MIIFSNLGFLSTKKSYQNLPQEWYPPFKGLIIKLQDKRVTKLFLPNNFVEKWLEAT